MTCGNSEESYQIIKASALLWNLADNLASLKLLLQELCGFVGLGVSWPYYTEDKVWTGEVGSRSRP